MSLCEPTNINQNQEPHPSQFNANETIKEVHMDRNGALTGDDGDSHNGSFYLLECRCRLK